MPKMLPTFAMLAIMWGSPVNAQPVTSFDEAIRIMNEFAFSPNGQSPEPNRAAVLRMREVTDFVIGRLSNPQSFGSPGSSSMSGSGQNGQQPQVGSIARFDGKWYELQSCLKTVRYGLFGHRCYTICELVWVPLDDKKRKYGSGHSGQSVLLRHAGALDDELVDILSTSGEPDAAKRDKIRELIKQVYSLSVIAKDPGFKAGSTTGP